MKSIQIITNNVTSLIVRYRRYKAIFNSKFEKKPIFTQKNRYFSGLSSQSIDFRKVTATKKTQGDCRRQTIASVAIVSYRQKQDFRLTLLNTTFQLTGSPVSVSLFHVKSNYVPESIDKQNNIPEPVSCHNNMPVSEFVSHNINDFQYVTSCIPYFNAIQNNISVSSRNKILFPTSNITISYLVLTDKQNYVNTTKPLYYANTGLSDIQNNIMDFRISMIMFGHLPINKLTNQSQSEPIKLSIRSNHAKNRMISQGLSEIGIRLTSLLTNFNYLFK